MKSDLKILVADDEDVVREFYSRALNSLGYQCDLAPDGRQCLNKFSESKYDILFLDIIMPGIDGEQVLDEIGANHPSTYIIIVSVQDDESAIKELFRRGASAYMTKPFSLDDIRKIMSQIEDRLADPKA